MEARLKQAVELLERYGSSTDLAKGYVALADWATGRGRPDEGLKWLSMADGGLRIGSSAPSISPEILWSRGNTRVELGDEGGVADLTAAIEAFESAGHPDEANRVREDLAYCRILTLGPVGATEGLLDMTATLGRRGFRVQEAWARTNLCDAAFDAGRWDECLEEIGWQLAAAIRVGQPNLHVWAESYRVAILSARGSLTEAIDVEECARKARSAPLDAAVRSLASCAVARQAAGDDEASASYLSEVERLTSGSGVSIRTLVLTACLRICREADAGLLAERLLLGLETPSAPRMRAAILTARSTLCEMRGTFGEALAGYQEAIPFGCLVVALWSLPTRATHPVDPSSSLEGIPKHERCCSMPHPRSGPWQPGL